VFESFCLLYSTPLSFYPLNSCSLPSILNMWLLVRTHVVLSFLFLKCSTAFLGNTTTITNSSISSSSESSTIASTTSSNGDDFLSIEAHSSSSQSSTSNANPSDSIITSSSAPSNVANTSRPGSNSDNHIIIPPPVSLKTSILSQSNVSVYNHTITSPPSLGPYLTTYVYDNQTHTQCPVVWGGYGQSEMDYKCCDYYNTNLDTAAFKSWITAGAEPSPSVGASYGCCAGCTIRAQSIQVYYWPGAGDLVICSSTSATSYTLLPGDPRYPQWKPVFPAADPAYECNNTTPKLVTTVIDEHTLTSPTPYIRFSSFWAYDWCGKRSGMLVVAILVLFLRD
jgi:hypothetical protein